MIHDAEEHRPDLSCRRGSHLFPGPRTVRERSLASSWGDDGPGSVFPTCAWVHGMTNPTTGPTRMTNRMVTLILDMSIALNASSTHVMIAVRTALPAVASTVALTNAAGIPAVASEVTSDVSKTEPSTR